MYYAVIYNIQSPSKWLLNSCWHIQLPFDDDDERHCDMATIKLVYNNLTAAANHQLYQRNMIELTQQIHSDDKYRRYRKRRRRVEEEEELVRSSVCSQLSVLS